MAYTGSKTSGMRFILMTWFVSLHHVGAVVSVHVFFFVFFYSKLNFSILFLRFNVKGIQDWTVINIIVYHSDCFETENLFFSFLFFLKESWPKTKSSWGNICLKHSIAEDDVHGVDYGSLTGIFPILYVAHRGFWSRLTHSGSAHGGEEEWVGGCWVGWQLFHVTGWSVKRWLLVGILQECGRTQIKSVVSCLSGLLFVFNLKQQPLKVAGCKYAAILVRLLQLRLSA